MPNDPKSIQLDGAAYSVVQHKPKLVSRPQTFRRPGERSKLLVDISIADRPYIAVPGENLAYVFPLPVEGFRIGGSATLGIHKYIGGKANDVDVLTVAIDEQRVSLNGIFPGDEGNANMREMIRFFEMEPPNKGKILSLPGILRNVLYVECERYDCYHSPGDFVDDIAYEISFVRKGTGPQLKPAAQLNEPDKRVPPKGKGKHVFIVRGVVKTLRLISIHLYGTPDNWYRLYIQNQALFNKTLKVPIQKVPNYQLPSGTKIFY